MKSAYCYFSNLAHKMTDRMANTTDHITSLLEVNIDVTEVTVSSDVLDAVQ